VLTWRTLLVAAYHLLPTTYYLPSSSYYVLSTDDHLVPTTYYLLSTTDPYVSSNFADVMNLSFRSCEVPAAWGEG
jgi:hypothetical protein